MDQDYRIRCATEEDVPAIHRLIILLAEYEKEPRSIVKLTEAELLRDGFGEEKYFHCFIVEQTPSAQRARTEVDVNGVTLPQGELIGYAFYFYTYSTWEGRTLYIEDIFVREGFRGKGIGSRLMKECAKQAVTKDCRRMNWQVLDWNTKAIDFYKRMGAKTLKEWLSIRMDRYALKAFTEADDHVGPA
ncbi:hypothetical protein EMCRGX_G026087 [Ephydatia muelleri]|eukprot:Em0021g833a